MSIIYLINIDKGWQWWWWWWWMMEDEWWMMNDEWWMMNDEWCMMNDEWWMVNGEWWMMNDEWWTWTPSRWMMNDEIPCSHTSWDLKIRQPVNKGTLDICLICNTAHHTAIWNLPDSSHCSKFRGMSSPPPAGSSPRGRFAAGAAWAMRTCDGFEATLTFDDFDNWWLWYEIRLWHLMILNLLMHADAGQEATSQTCHAMCNYCVSKQAKWQSMVLHDNHVQIENVIKLSWTFDIWHLMTLVWLWHLMTLAKWQAMVLHDSNAQARTCNQTELNTSGAASASSTSISTSSGSELETMPASSCANHT